MEKKVLLKLHGIDVNVIIRDGKLSRSAHYSYGQIYFTCPINTPNFVLKGYLERIFKKSLLEKFDKEPLYNENYCFVLGEKRRLIRPYSNLEINKGDIIIKDDEDLMNKLKRLFQDIIISRVRRYEVIMNTKKHEVKVTNMSAARGKNYYSKGLLTFSYELIFFSIELIDAIVIHELAHDFYQNHSKSFYDIVYTYCKDYDIRINKLTFGVKK